MQPTPYQYVKLGANLEFLRGISTISVMQTTSLVAFPNLMENLSARRYSVMQVVISLKSLLVQLEELGLARSLRVAESCRPMIAEMEQYLAAQPRPELAYVNDPSAEYLVGLTRQVVATVRSELGMAAQGDATSEAASLSESAERP